MRDVIINSVSGGLVTDLSEDVTKNSVLTKAENVDIVTTTDNNFVLQKRDGTTKVMNGDNPVEIPLATPIAVKELNNVAYIVSIKDDEGKMEIGTFPSPDWDNIIIKDLGIGVGTADIINTVYNVEVTSNTYFEFSSSYYPAIMDPSYRIKHTAYIYIENTGINNDTYNLSMDTNDSWKFGDAVSNTLVSTAVITVPSGTSVYVPIICDTAIEPIAGGTTDTAETVVTIDPTSTASAQTVTIPVRPIGWTYYGDGSIADVSTATVETESTDYIILKVNLGLGANTYAFGQTNDEENDLVVWAEDGGSLVPYKTEVVYDNMSTYLYKVKTFSYSDLDGYAVNACKQIYNCFETSYYLKVYINNFSTNNQWIIVYFRNGMSGTNKQIIVEFNHPSGGDGGEV